MTKRHRDAVIRLAEDVCDGTPVDWVRERTSQPSMRPVLDGLAVIERVRDVFRPRPGRRPATAPAQDDSVTITADARVGTPASPLFTWGTLRVLEQVGEGGPSFVYRAHDPTLDTEVALKLLKPEIERDAASVERFIEEARGLACVHHPNVLVVHGADRRDGRVGMWSELVHGETLEEIVRRAGAMSAREAANVGIDVCRALAAVHAHGLVHRDVKASNVMREKGGRIVLMDFGSVTRSPRRGEVEQTVHIHGTPATMAPEQARGEVRGPETDVYGVGVLLYYLVTGQRPLEIHSVPELVSKHEKDVHVPLRDRRADLPPAFVEVVERAIAHDPEARYSGAGALEHALHEALRPPMPDRFGLIVARRERTRLVARWGLASAAVVLVAVVIGLGAWQRISRQPSVTPPAPQAPATLEATAILHRLVGAADQPVPTGASVAPGDRLSMNLTANERMYVYVLNTDSEGNTFVLFPLPGVGLSNPLEAHRIYRLPGNIGKRLVNWDVTSAGGRETIIALGSRVPLGSIDSLVAALPKAEEGRPARLEPGNLTVLRGIGGLSTITPTPEQQAQRMVQQVQEMVQSLQARRAEHGDVWIWQTELENPPPKD